MKNSIIGVFDRVAGGIRYYCLELHKEIGGEKIDISSFYLKYKGHKDDFKSSDRRIALWRPIVISKGKTIYFNIYDSRINLLSLPTLIANKILGRRIIGIIHHEAPLEKSIFDRISIDFVFDSFISHKKSLKERSGKPVAYKELKVQHDMTGLSKEKCRERLKIPKSANVTLFFGHIRPYKKIEEFTEKFLKKAGKNDLLLIVGKKWYDIKLPSDKRLEVREGFVPDEQSGMYFKACDRVAIPYDLEKSAIYYIAKLYNKRVVKL